MNIKIQFVTQDERQSIINEKANLLLIEQQYLTEGNFLIFTDAVMGAQLLQEENTEIKLALAELAELIAGGAI